MNSSIFSSSKFFSRNFCVASSSSTGSRMALAGSVVGASVFRSMAWLYGHDGGNHLEASSLNTFANCWYSWGSTTSAFALNACSTNLEAVVCQESAALILMGSLFLGHSTMGIWAYLSHPRAQSICGCIAANHG